MIHRHRFCSSYAAIISFVSVSVLFALVPALRAEDLGASLAKQLAASITNGPLSVGVGNFLYQDSRQMSAFSSVLNAQVETAVSNLPSFELVPHEQLVIIQLFHGPLPLDPGESIGSAHWTKPQAVVRGRFFLQDSNVLAVAELLRLEDGKVLAQASNSLPRAEVAAANPSGAEDFLPPNFAQGEENIKDVETRLAKVPHDFAVDLAIKQSRHNFAKGERYELRIRAPQDCYVAVFDHEVDGSTVLLFPNSRHTNDWNTNDWIPANIATDIPSPDNRVLFLRVSPPFGADVIQVIACTSESELHKAMVRAAAAPANSQRMLAPVSRQGVAVQMGRANAPATTNDVKWAEAHLVLSSYPAPARSTNQAPSNLKINYGPGFGLDAPTSK
jgi:hypothetical protein